MRFRDNRDFYFCECIILAALITLFGAISFGHAAVRDPHTIIADLNAQLESENDPVERAKLCCYRARQQIKLKNYQAAEEDYLKALGEDMNGWIMNEFGYFLYRNGQFEKAYKLAYNLEKQFPGFAEDAQKLGKMAKEKYEQEYYKEHPPTITMNTTPNYNYVSRLQLIEQVKAREAAEAHNSQDVIYSNCKQKWGTDYRMVKYCIEKQTTAQAAVSTQRGGIIKSQCEQKWGTDYRMVKYCMEKQSTAKRSVDRRGGGIIKSQCEQKWGTDYRMVEYCIEKQTEAKRSIDRRYN